MTKENNEWKEKYVIQKKIKNINNQILFIIIKLQSISEKINVITMNNNSHLKNEEDYINNLMKMDKMLIKEKDKIQKKRIKESNDIFKDTIKMNNDE